MNEVEISENCERCGKPIAAMPKGHALCCECRYGPNAWEDRLGDVELEDCVEHYDRLRGFDFSEDELDKFEEDEQWKRPAG